eukprot:g14727.t1
MTEVTDAHEAGPGVAAAGEDNQYETADEGESEPAREILRGDRRLSSASGGRASTTLSSSSTASCTCTNLVQEHAQPEQGGQTPAVGRGPLASFTDGMRSALPVGDAPPEQNNHEGKGSSVFRVHVKIGLGGEQRWTFEYPWARSQRDMPTVDDLYNRTKTRILATSLNDASGRIIDDGSDTITNTTLLLEEQTAADLVFGAARSKLSFVYRHAKLVPNATYQLVRGAGPRVLHTSNAEGEAFFFQNGQYSGSRAVESLGQDTVDLQIRALPFASLMYKDQGRVPLCN